MAGYWESVTPFCSCSAIPLFLGFVEAEIPLGCNFSFLIAAPLSTKWLWLCLSDCWLEISPHLFYQGLLLQLLRDGIIGKLKLEKWIQDWVFQKPSWWCPNHKFKFGRPPQKRFFRQWKIFYPKIWIYWLRGLQSELLFMDMFPTTFLFRYWTNLLVKINRCHYQCWWVIPLYSCPGGAVPVAFSLIEKGVPLGTALAFYDVGNRHIATRMIIWRKY